MNIVNIFRWLHILSGAAWLGEVVTINFVLVPSLKSMDAKEKSRYISEVFPRLFRLASALSLVSIFSGLTMTYLISGWRDLSIFLTSRWGIAILIGGLLGLSLTAFHFLVERKLEPVASSLEEGTQEEEVERMMKVLKSVPRAGLAVMVVIFLLMMYAARGV